LPDHEPPDLAELTRSIAAAHDAGRPVALHSVTQLTVAVAIAALTAVGSMPGDRLEHAAMCDDAAAEQLAALGVVVVTQPSIFRRHARDFLAELDVPDRPHLWRYGGLLRAGLAVVSSSDAPYGDVDPWQAIAAAAQREPSDERVPAATALGSYLTRPLDIAGPPRAVAAGEPADLCLLSRPLRSALSGVGHLSACVVAVFIGGELTSGPPADGRAFNA
jgi:predicted amidohydrolase YtcJ